MLLNESSSKNDSCSANDFRTSQQDEQLYVQLSTFWYCFLALITTIGLLVSSISNAIIIYLFTSTPSLRKNPSNIIAVNLSLSDMLYCIQWPSVIYCCLTQSTWILEYEFICKSLGFITVSTALVSITTVLVMSIERAIVVKYSLRAKNRINIKLAWLIIILIWLVCLCSCIPPLFGKINRYTLDPSKTSCTLDYLTRHSDYKSYILILYIGYYALPMIAISISYFIIISTFNKSSSNLEELTYGARPDSGTGTEISSSNSSSSIAHHARKVKNSLKLKNLTFLNQSSRETQNQNEHKIIHNLNINNSSTILHSFAKIHSAQRRASVSGIENLGAFRSSLSSQSCCNNTTIDSTNLNRNYEQKNRHSLYKNTSVYIIPRQLRVVREATNAKRLDPSATHLMIPELKLIRGKEKAFNHSTPILCNDHNKTRSLYRTLSNIANSRASNEQFDIGARNLFHFRTQAKRSQQARNALQFRLAKMSFYLILLWLVSWSPIAWLAMLNSILNCPSVSATAVFFASTMTKLGPAFDVFIYGLSHPKLKSKFRCIIKRLFMLS